MRKLILIIATAIVPLGIWTAGCRNNNRQAAFPNTPEIKALAKSAETVSPTTPPVINAAPIDREILNLPERDTFARVQATNDRANKLARRDPAAGLFTLPEESNYVAQAASAPTYDQASLQPAPAAMTPVPSAREFWSRPAKPLRSRPADMPGDVSAMAAPGEVYLTYPDTFMTPPASMPVMQSFPDVGEGQIMPLESVPGLFNGHDAGMDTFIDNPPPASSGWIGMRNGQGDALGAPPLSSREMTTAKAAPDRRKSEPTERGPLKLDVNTLLGALSQVDRSDRQTARSMDAAPTVSAAVFPSASAAPMIQPGAPVVSSRGLEAFEPLPEPIPLEQYRAMNRTAVAKTGKKPAASRTRMAHTIPAAPIANPATAMPTLPAELLMAAPAPEAQPTTPADLFREPAKSKPAMRQQPTTKTAQPQARTPVVNDMKQALAPLPELSTRVDTPAKPAKSAKPVKTATKTATKTTKPARTRAVSMPEPVANPLPSPELTMAKSALMDFSPEAMDEAFAELNKTEFFKTDVWETPAAKPVARKTEKVEAIEAKALPLLPELSEPALAKPSAPPIVEMEAPESVAKSTKGKDIFPTAYESKEPMPAFSNSPEKIKMKPMRSQQRVRAIPELEEIDSAAVAPPLKF